MSSRTKDTTLAISRGGSNESSKAVADSRALPYDGIVRRRQSLIQSAAAPCPEAVIRGHVNAVEAAEKGIALGSKLAREGFRIAIVGALQEMSNARCVA